MYYNYIMWQSIQSQPNFLFNQPQQSPALEIIINKKSSQLSYHNHLITLQNNLQNIPPSNHQSFNKQKQTILIKVEPIKEATYKQPSQSNQNFLLEYVSQKDDEQAVSIVNKVNFHEEQSFEEVELSPQSSLRKLFKATTSDLSEEVQKYESQQKMIKSQIIEKESRLQEQEQEQQEDEKNYAHYKQLHSNTLHDLINYPVLKSKMIKCVVKVTNNRFFSFQSTYDIYLFQQKRHLLRAKKKRYRFSTYFDVIGKDRDQIQQFAKVKSNFTRTQYKLIQFKKNVQFSQSSSQKSIQSPFGSSLIKLSPIRTEEQQIIEKQDCYLAYEPNFLGLSQQRLILLKSKKSLLKSQRFSDLKNCYQNCEQGRFRKFTTRLAEKRLDGKLTLDFKQKNLIDSSKNMIIEDQYGEAGLVFAKVREDLYVLNVMHPFNILQGFFLALCNLDRKILNR